MFQAYALPRLLEKRLLSRCSVVTGYWRQRLSYTCSVKLPFRQELVGELRKDEIQCVI